MRASSTPTVFSRSTPSCVIYGRSDVALAVATPTALLVVALALADVAGSAARVPAPVAGYELKPLPVAARAECRRTQGAVAFPLLCPRYLPRAADGTVARVSARVSGRSGSAWASVSFGYGVGLDPEHWEWNNPDLFLHFVVFAGAIPDAALELRGSHPQQVVARRTLGGHSGILYGQVSYAECGCGLGGHYTFVWRERGVRYAASLHRWRPQPTAGGAGGADSVSRADARLTLVGAV